MLAGLLFLLDAFAALASVPAYGGVAADAVVLDARGGRFPPDAFPPAAADGLGGAHSAAALDAGGELAAVGQLGVHALVDDLLVGVLGRGVDAAGECPCERVGATQVVFVTEHPRNSQYALSRGGTGARGAFEADAVMAVLVA